MNEIELLQVKQLIHHPDNPRKDLGDLEELTGSIKANGILQNLTVVRPDGWKGEDGDIYWVLIGNRRLEAAKAAGLKELPCQIVRMGHTEQIATMLQENMQRSDLTVYEQAKGIQMMMDLGFDKDQIIERTGFSRSTIERRLAVASLPEEETKQAVDLGYDLLDLVEISKIGSRKQQEELLRDSSRTDDGRVDRNWLRMKIAAIKREEDRKRETERLLPCVKMFAKEMTKQQIDQRWSVSWEHLHKYDVELKPDATVKRPKEEGPYYYYISWNTIEIWQKAKKAKHEKTDAEIALEKKQHEAKELNARMRENRIAFCSSWKPSRMQESALKAKLWQYVFDNVSSYDNGAFQISYHSWDSNRFRQYCGMPKEEGRDPKETIYAEMARRGIPMGRAILAWILCGGVRADDRNGYAGEYRGDYTADVDLDRIYDILTDAGYQLTEEEQQWKDGTHPIYPRKPAKKPDDAPEPEDPDEAPEEDA